MSVSKRFLLRTIFVLVLILAMFLVACNKDKDDGTDEPIAVTLPVFNGEKEDLNTESLTSLIHNYYGGIPQQESESPESKLDDAFVNSVKSASGFKADNVSYEVYQKYTSDCIALGYEIEGELVEDDIKIIMLRADTYKYVLLTLDKGSFVALMFEVSPPEVYYWATAAELSVMRLAGFSQPQGSEVRYKDTTSSHAIGQYDSLTIELSNISSAALSSIKATLASLGYIKDSYLQYDTETHYSAYKIDKDEVFVCDMDNANRNDALILYLRFYNKTQYDICSRGKAIGDVYSEAEFSITTTSVRKEKGVSVTGITTDSFIYNANGLVSYNSFIPEVGGRVYNQTERKNYILTNGGHNLLADDTIPVYTTREAANNGYSVIGDYYLKSGDKVKTGKTKTITDRLCDEVSGTLIRSGDNGDSNVSQALFYIERDSGLCLGYESGEKGDNYIKSIYFTGFSSGETDTDKYLSLPPDGAQLDKLPEEVILSQSGLADFPNANGATGYYVAYNYERIDEAKVLDADNFTLVVRFRIFGLDANEFITYKNKLIDYGFSGENSNTLEKTLTNLDIVNLHFLDSTQIEGNYREFYFTYTKFIPLQLPQNTYISITYNYDSADGPATHKDTIIFEQDYIYYNSLFTYYKQKTPRYFLKNADGTYTSYSSDIAYRIINNMPDYEAPMSKADIKRWFTSDTVLSYMFMQVDTRWERIGIATLIDKACVIYRDEYSNTYYINEAEGLLYKYENGGKTIFQIDAVTLADAVADRVFPSCTDADYTLPLERSDEDYISKNFSSYIKSTYILTPEKLLAYYQSLDMFTQIYCNINSYYDDVLAMDIIYALSASLTDGEHRLFELEYISGILYTTEYVLINDVDSFIGYAYGAEYNDFYDIFGDSVITYKLYDALFTITIDGNYLYLQSNSTLYELTSEGVFASSYQIVDGKAVISDRHRDDYLSECTTMSSLCLRMIDPNFTLKYKLNLLEEKGNAVIADRLCTHYYGSITYYGEANYIDIYVDDATGIILKYIYHIDHEIGSEIISVSQGADQLLLP